MEIHVKLDAILQIDVIDKSTSCTHEFSKSKFNAFGVKTRSAGWYSSEFDKVGLTEAQMIENGYLIDENTMIVYNKPYVFIHTKVSKIKKAHNTFEEAREYCEYLKDQIISGKSFEIIIT